MNTHAEKTQKNKNQSVANSVAQKQSRGESAFQFADNRPEAIAQMNLQEMANNSPRAMQLRAFQEMANNGSTQMVLQRKAGIESFDVEWSTSDDASETDEKFEIDFEAKFKDDDEFTPGDAEFRQNAGDELKIIDGPHKGDPDYEYDEPFHDDGYSRAKDPDDYDGKNFKSDDVPGIDTLDKDDNIAYKFWAEQIIVDTSDGDKEVSKKAEHTVTIKGKAPRTYTGLPHSSS